MTDVDWTLHNFDEILEYVAEMVGGDFITVVNYANDIIDHPEEYTGLHAVTFARKLAGYRVKIGVAHQYWKITAPQTQKKRDRLINNALAVMYDALLELINTLKLQARQELN